MQCALQSINIVEIVSMSNLRWKSLEYKRDLAYLVLILSIAISYG